MFAFLRFAASVGATANWMLVFTAAVIAVFLLYVGVAMCAVFHAKTADQQKLRYKVFQDLLRVFGGWWHR